MGKKKKTRNKKETEILNTTERVRAVYIYIRLPNAVVIPNKKRRKKKKQTRSITTSGHSIKWYSIAGLQVTNEPVA